MLHAKRMIISIVIWNAILSFYHYFLGMELAVSGIFALTLLYMFDKALEDRNVEKGVKLPRGMI